jgi:hypothetical protein
VKAAIEMPSKRRTAMNTPSIRKFSAAFFTAALAVASLAPQLQAQDQATAGTVNVPFAFETGNQHFEPGVYTIRMEATHIASIKGTSRTGFVMIQSDGDRRTANKSKVVFRKSGNRYFLGEIWIAEKSGHLEVVKSKAERRMQVAEQKSEPTGVELALVEPAR